MSKDDEPGPEPPADSSPELFNTQAAGFDGRAGLPADVCREIARKVIELGEVAAEDLLLEIGAGTGQIGQWLGARARYVGLDLSAGMLLEFARRLTGSEATGALIQADANLAWPVADGMTRAIFGSRVLHLLNPQRVVDQATRVASPKGATLIIGRVKRHPDSVRARMASEMNERLRRRGYETQRGEQGDRQLIEACCERGAQLLPTVTVASWQSSSSPRQSLASWRSIQKLGGLPLAARLRNLVLDELEDWARTVFGKLDEPVASEETYVLKVLRFPPSPVKNRFLTTSPKDKVRSPMQNELLTDLGKSLLVGSLDDERLMAQTGEPPAVQILPEANVIKVGGQSFIDRGRAAVFPLIEEIVANLGRHKMIIGTGAGTRARHAYSVGLDLGLPTGVLSVLGTFVSMQNARMLNYLLAKHGIPFIEPAQFAQLPHYLAERGAVVFFGMPPYIYWHQNPALGRIPPHRTDTGTYLVSEVFGAKSMIFVKDEDGLYTADPKKDRHARFIPKITVAELAELDLQDVVVERSILELLPRATYRRSIQVVNGLKPGNLTRALDGEHVGTIITAD